MIFRRLKNRYFKYQGNIQMKKQITQIAKYYAKEGEVEALKAAILKLLNDVLKE